MTIHHFSLFLMAMKVEGSLPVLNMLNVVLLVLDTDRVLEAKLHVLSLMTVTDSAGEADHGSGRDAPLRSEVGAPLGATDL